MVIACASAGVPHPSLLFVSVLARGRALASSLRGEAKQSSRKRRTGLLRRFAPRNDAGSNKLARKKTRRENGNSLLVIAGLDPAIHAACSLAVFRRGGAAARRHGPPGQARR